LSFCKVNPHPSHLNFCVELLVGDGVILNDSTVIPMEHSVKRGAQRGINLSILILRVSDPYKIVMFRRFNVYCASVSTFEKANHYKIYSFCNNQSTTLIFRIPSYTGLKSISVVRRNLGFESFIALSEASSRSSVSGLSVVHDT
jgi:hypothetical protein